MSPKRVRAAILAAAALGVGGCATTIITDTWKSPETQRLEFHKMLGLVIVKNESLRRVAEDVLRSSLPTVQAVPSYTVLQPGDLENREQAKERLQREGFDGVVALRFVDSSQQLRAMPAGGYPTFWGYWGDAYPPGDLTVDVIVRVEINVFSLVEDKLVWAGVSETIDPGSAEQLVTEIVEAAGKEMRKQGLIS